MVTDDHAALLFTLENAKAKRELTVELIGEINSLVMKHMGKIYHMVFGVSNSSTGAFRKWNVTNGFN